MSGKWAKVRSSDGGEFDCYLSIPKTAAQVPAVVLACAVHGVDADLVAIADEFAAHGFIAAAPDLFWRTVPGALSHDDGRAQERSQPRLEKITQGEADMADTLARLADLPECADGCGRTKARFAARVRRARAFQQTCGAET
jgi:carboxymethylenebutenolidase